MSYQIVNKPPTNLQAQAILNVVKYLWEKELSDYLDQRYDGLAANDGAHIFTSMALADQVVGGHEKTAEGFMVEFCENNGIEIPEED